MTNQIENYREAVDLAVKHLKLTAYDSPYIFSSDSDDVYRLIQHVGRRPDAIHKSTGYSWIIDGQRYRFSKDHRSICKE